MAVTQSALVDDYVAKGSAVTDSQAAKNRGAVGGNKLRVQAGTIALNTDSDFDADGDVMVLCPLHIDDVVHQIWIGNDDLDGGTDSAFNLGLYVDAAGTDVESESAYASAVTQLRSATALTDLAFEARDINTVGQSVWEDAGYSDRDAALAATEASNGRLFLAMTETATVGSAQDGDLSFVVVYSSDQ